MAASLAEVWVRSAVVVAEEEHEEVAEEMETMGPSFAMNALPSVLSCDEDASEEEVAFPLMRVFVVESASERESFQVDSAEVKFWSGLRQNRACGLSVG